jgi:hypothetical protein
MLRRFLLIAVGLTATIAMVAGLFYLRSNIPAGTDLLSAVAEDAVIVIKAETAGTLLSSVNNSSLWTDLNSILKSDGLATRGKILDSLLRLEGGAGGLHPDMPLCLSVHPAGRDRFDVVFYTSFPSGKGSTKLSDESLRKLLPPGAKVRERTFGRVKVYESAFKKEGKKMILSWAISHGVIIISFSPVLLENSVSQLLSGSSLTDDPYFQKVLATSGTNVDANIFINLSRFPSFLSGFSGGDARGYLSGLSDLGNWAELDLHIRNDALLLNGFSVSSEGENNYLNVFSGQSPVHLEIESVIPGFASAFLALAITDGDLFHKNYTGWLQETGRYPGYVQMRDEFSRLTGADPEGIFHGLMEKEAAIVHTGRDDRGGRGESFLVIRTRGRSIALEALQELLRYSSGLTGEQSARHIYRVDGDKSFEIIGFPYERVGELLFGKFFSPVKTSWFSFTGNYLVFGESPVALSGFLHANVLNQTLKGEKGFREFSEYLVSGNNLHFYASIPRSAGLLSDLFRDDIAGNLIDNPGPAKNFRAFSLQFSTGREMGYNNIYLGYAGKAGEEPGTEWQTLLDTITDFKPHLLLNHNTGENEIFVQDLNNTIYLINSAGRILWKRHLPGKIMGRVWQIDYFKNNRLQMLFNTREHLFLIDRNGNDVARYPLRMASPATSGLAVFDYDNNKDYRIFTASEDKSVVVRSKEGSIVAGWKFPGTEHNVYNEIKHIRTGGRDYIVFADRQRMYITDRQGGIRVKPEVHFPPSLRNEIAFEERTPASGPRLVLSDSTGKVWHVYLNGKTEQVTGREYSAGHFFEYHDISGDGHKDHIFLDNNRLDVYSGEGSLLFTHQFRSAIDLAPSFYNFSRNERKLGVVSRNESLIYLFNSDGEIFNGFPLSGRSFFTVGSLERGKKNFQLLVGSDSNFLYNYTVFQPE